MRSHLLNQDYYTAVAQYSSREYCSKKKVRMFMKNKIIKTVLDAMKQQTVEILSKTPLEVLSTEIVEKETDGEKEKNIRLFIEVPREKDNIFSRLRFTAKLNYSKQAEELEEGTLVYLEGLAISYISNSGDVFFKAESFSVL